MSNDQMQDVFPILFRFAEGQQPTEKTLSGLIKYLDVAFGDITRSVGDPWDQTTHICDLSVEKLSQSSLARIMGPSDYLSPHGGCWSELTATTTVVLNDGKNQWSVGYPLVTISSVPAPGTTASSAYTAITWSTDVVVSGDTAGVLTTRKTTPEAVTADGDFYVDFFRGEIIAYTVAPANITLTITDLAQLGAGVPWGTHNVIPSWNDTTASLCSVSWVSDDVDNGTSTWLLTFPTVNSSPRYSTIGKLIGDSSDLDATWGTSIPGYDSNYRLPYSIVSALSEGDEIPGGYCELWDVLQNRVVPLVTFVYRTTNTLTLQTPYSATGWLTEGENYRVFTSGTSVSEAISHLLVAQRYNEHNGLVGYHTAGLHYTIPVSHNLLTNLYSAETESYGDIEESAFRFSKSNYSSNPHPQYIHRAGYMEDDEEGNTANAMRGNLVFSGTYNSSSDLYPIGTEGLGTSTYGIQFGGSGGTLYTAPPKFAWEGGSSTTYSSGYATKFGFGLEEVGINAVASHTNEYYGAVTYTPWYGMPLYLRGAVSYASNGASYLGAVLAFDMGRHSEMNYLKLYPGIRNGTYDPAHLPANTGQTNFTSPHSTSPSLSKVSPSQVRELRFRGVSYIQASSTSNGLTDSLGGSITRAPASGITEFQQYWVSPGILGADFFNVYSNAIFFSDTGDGKLTSFTSNGEDWLNNSAGTYDTESCLFSEYMPTGLYYFPHTSYNGNRFVFSVYDTTASSATQPLLIGDRSGLAYLSSFGSNILLGTHTGGTINILAGSTAIDNITTVDDNINIVADNDINMTATNSILLTSLVTSATLGINLSAPNAQVDITSSLLDINVNTLTIDSTGGFNIVSTSSTVDSSITLGHELDIYVNNSPLILTATPVTIFGSSASYDNSYLNVAQTAIKAVAHGGAGSYIYLASTGSASLLANGGMLTLKGDGSSGGVDGIGMRIILPSGVTTGTSLHLNLAEGQTILEGSTLKIHANGEIYMEKDDLYEQV